MSVEKERFLSDFRVTVDSSRYPLEQTRKMNGALFATYEPITLWLRARRMRGPFFQVQVLLKDEGLSRARAPIVGYGATGRCVIYEHVDHAILLEKAGNRRWIVDRVLAALARAAEETGWRSAEFEAMLEDFAQKPWPAIHYFEKLRATERHSGITCLPWISFQPGHTKIGVRISKTGKPDRDVEVLSKNDPIWLEDFPLAKTKIQSGQLLILDKDGKTLATVPIDKDALH